MSPKRLLWIGSPFFSPALKNCGWDVRIHNFEHTAVLDWDDVVRLAGGKPDVLVVADKSRPPFVTGMERFDCLTVFYAVDTHIHSWYPLYAQGFDACLVSLKDHMPSFLQKRLLPEQVLWSPAYAPDLAPNPVSPSAPPAPLPTRPAGIPPAPLTAHPEWDCLFVGTVNPVTTPRRAEFLRVLAERVPLTVTRGNYRALYPRARVVLNYCELGDLNFRVFEALGCGACLVTPEVGHGFGELFVPGADLLTYAVTDSAEATADNAEQAIRTVLETPALRTTLAAHGFAAVNAAHRARHRAERFSEFLRALPPSLPAERRNTAETIRTTWLKRPYLHLAETSEATLLRKAYLAAALGQ